MRSQHAERQRRRAASGERNGAGDDRTTIEGAGCRLVLGRGAVGVAECPGLDWVAAWSVVAERWDVRGAWGGWVAASVVVAKRGPSNPPAVLFHGWWERSNRLGRLRCCLGCGRGAVGRATRQPCCSTAGGSGRTGWGGWVAASVVVAERRASRSGWTGLGCRLMLGRGAECQSKWLGRLGCCLGCGRGAVGLGPACGPCRRAPARSAAGTRDAAPGIGTGLGQGQSGVCWLQRGCTWRNVAACGARWVGSGSVMGGGACVRLAA